MIARFKDKAVTAAYTASPAAKIAQCLGQMSPLGSAVAFKKARPGRWCSISAAATSINAAVIKAIYGFPNFQPVLKKPVRKMPLNAAKTMRHHARYTGLAFIMKFSAYTRELPRYAMRRMVNTSETGGGLVQNQKIRAVGKRQRQIQLDLHPLREFRGGLVLVQGKRVQIAAAGGGVPSLRPRYCGCLSSILFYSSHFLNINRYSCAISKKLYLILTIDFS